jgi:hypothetical protein
MLNRNRSDEDRGGKQRARYGVIHLIPSPSPMERGVLERRFHTGFGITKYGLLAVYS